MCRVRTVCPEVGPSLAGVGGRALGPQRVQAGVGLSGGVGVVGGLLPGRQRGRLVRGQHLARLEGDLGRRQALVGVQHLRPGLHRHRVVGPGPPGPQDRVPNGNPGTGCVHVLLLGRDLLLLPGRLGHQGLRLPRPVRGRAVLDPVDLGLGPPRRRLVTRKARPARGLLPFGLLHHVPDRVRRVGHDRLGGTDRTRVDVPGRRASLHGSGPMQRSMEPPSPARLLRPHSGTDTVVRANPCIANPIVHRRRAPVAY